MAQTYIKQLIFSWLRMVHREIALLYREIAFASGNNISINRERSAFPITFMFTRQIPPSHQSRDKPWQRIHYVHEPLPPDIPPSAAL